MTYNFFYISLFLLPIINVAYCGRFSEYDVGLKVFHNFDLKTDEFTECGDYNFYFGNSEIKQQCLTPSIRAFIKELQHLDHANYRMKIDLNLQDKQYTFYTFIPFNQLVQSNYQYSFKITVDDNLLPMAVTAKVMTGSPKSLLGDNSYIDVFFKNMEQGPQPDTATFIHKMEREREAKEKGTNQDNRSFLAKYWIYILPLLIFAVLSGSVNGDAGGNQR